MLPVANHLPLRFDNPPQRVRSRVRICARKSVAICTRALRDILHGFTLATLAIALGWLIAWLVCTL